MISEFTPISQGSAIITLKENNFRESDSFLKVVNKKMAVLSETTNVNTFVEKDTENPFITAEPLGTPKTVKVEEVD